MAKRGVLKKKIRKAAALQLAALGVCFALFPSSAQARTPASRASAGTRRTRTTASATSASNSSSPVYYTYTAASRRSAPLDTEFSAIIASCGFPAGTHILHVVSTDTRTGTAGSSSKAAFSTIQEAVDAAKEGDVIAVEPGKYQESVDCHDKTVHIVGRSRTDCVIEYPTDNYFDPPLAMSAGSIWNMTVHGTNGSQDGDGTRYGTSDSPEAPGTSISQDVSQDITGSDSQQSASGTKSSQEKQITDGSCSSLAAEWNTAQTPRAYCLHVDYDHLSGLSLSVNNCTFLNDVNCAVGIGLRGNSTVEFYNCSLCSTGGGEALYFHDYDTISGGTVAGQKIALRYCTLTAATTTTATLSIHSQEIGGYPADILLENNRIYNNADGMIMLLASSTGDWLQNDGYLGSSDFTLSSASSGNNCALMNFDTYAAAYQQYATALHGGQTSAWLGELQKSYALYSSER